MASFLKRTFLLSVGLLLASANVSRAGHFESVRVGAYDFPPIATVDAHQRAHGLLGDLLGELESTHEHFVFRIVHTSPKRRHLDFQNGLYDVMFFEHPSWSWDTDAIDVSRPLLRDDEVYVALAKPGRDQSFFDDVSQHRIVAIAGYHYGFAGLETDSEELTQRFNIELSHSHDRNLDLIKADRPSVAEVAVVSRSFLNRYFDQFPDERERFLVSERVDQSYELHVVSRRQGPISIQQIESLLQPLIESGRYQSMVREHGLQLPEGMASSP